MIDIECLINSLNKATVLEVKRDKNSFTTVSMHIPTNDLDDMYSLSSGGKGFILHWKGMDLITEDICLLKEDFSLLYIEVLKELMKREGYKLVPVEINNEIESAMFSSVARGEMPCDIYKAMIGAVK